MFLSRNMPALAPLFESCRYLLQKMKTFEKGLLGSRHCFTLDGIMHAHGWCVLILISLFQVKERAEEIAKAMEHEDGVEGVVKAFYKHFPLGSLNLDPESLPARLMHRNSSRLSLRRCFGCSWFADVKSPPFDLCDPCLWSHASCKIFVVLPIGNANFVDSYWFRVHISSLSWMR